MEPTAEAKCNPEDALEQHAIGAVAEKAARAPPPPSSRFQWVRRMLGYRSVRVPLYAMVWVLARAAIGTSCYGMGASSSSSLSTSTNMASTAAGPGRIPAAGAVALWTSLGICILLEYSSEVFATVVNVLCPSLMRRSLRGVFEETAIIAGDDVIARKLLCCSSPSRISVDIAGGKLLLAGMRLMVIQKSRNSRLPVGEEPREGKAAEISSAAVSADFCERSPGSLQQLQHGHALLRIDVDECSVHLSKLIRYSGWFSRVEEDAGERGGMVVRGNGVRVRASLFGHDQCAENRNAMVMSMARGISGGQDQKWIVPAGDLNSLESHISAEVKSFLSCTRSRRAPPLREGGDEALIASSPSYVARWLGHLRALVPVSLDTRSMVLLSANVSNVSLSLVDYHPLRDQPGLDGDVEEEKAEILDEDPGAVLRSSGSIPLSRLTQSAAAHKFVLSMSEIVARKTSLGDFEEWKVSIVEAGVTSSRGVDDGAGEVGSRETDILWNSSWNLLVTIDGSSRTVCNVQVRAECPIALSIDSFTMVYAESVVKVLNQYLRDQREPMAVPHSAIGVRSVEVILKSLRILIAKSFEDESFAGVLRGLPRHVVDAMVQHRGSRSGFALACDQVRLVVSACDDGFNQHAVHMGSREFFFACMKHLPLVEPPVVDAVNSMVSFACNGACPFASSGLVETIPALLRLSSYESVGAHSSASTHRAIDVYGRVGEKKDDVKDVDMTDEHECMEGDNDEQKAHVYLGDVLCHFDPSSTMDVAMGVMDALVGARFGLNDSSTWDNEATSRVHADHVGSPNSRSRVYGDVRGCVQRIQCDLYLGGDGVGIIRAEKTELLRHCPGAVSEVSVSCIGLNILDSSAAGRRHPLCFQFQSGDDTFLDQKVWKSLPLESHRRIEAVWTSSASNESSTVNITVPCAEIVFVNRFVLEMFHWFKDHALRCVQRCLSHEAWTQGRDNRNVSQSAEHPSAPAFVATVVLQYPRMLCPLTSKSDADEAVVLTAEHMIIAVGGALGDKPLTVKPVICGLEYEGAATGYSNRKIRADVRKEHARHKEDERVAKRLKASPRSASFMTPRRRSHTAFPGMHDPGVAPGATRSDVEGEGEGFSAGYSFFPRSRIYVRHMRMDMRMHSEVQSCRNRACACECPFCGRENGDSNARSSPTRCPYGVYHECVPPIDLAVGFGVGSLVQQPSLGDNVALTPPTVVLVEASGLPLRFSPLVFDRFVLWLMWGIMEPTVSVSYEQFSYRDEDPRVVMCLRVPDEACSLTLLDDGPSTADVRSEWLHGSFTGGVELFCTTFNRYTTTDFSAGALRLWNTATGQPMLWADDESWERKGGSTDTGDYAVEPALLPSVPECIGGTLGICDWERTFTTHRGVRGEGEHERDKTETDGGVFPNSTPRRGAAAPPISDDDDDGHDDSHARAFVFRMIFSYEGSFTEIDVRHSYVFGTPDPWQRLSAKFSRPFRLWFPSEILLLADEYPYLPEWIISTSVCLDSCQVCTPDCVRTQSGDIDGLHHKRKKGSHEVSSNQRQMAKSPVLGERQKVSDSMWETWRVFSVSAPYYQIDFSQVVYWKNVMGTQVQNLQDFPFLHEEEKRMHNITCPLAVLPKVISRTSNRRCNRSKVLHYQSELLIDIDDASGSLLHLWRGRGRHMRPDRFLNDYQKMGCCGKTDGLGSNEQISFARNPPVINIIHKWKQRVKFVFDDVTGNIQTSIPAISLDVSLRDCEAFVEIGKVLLRQLKDPSLPMSPPFSVYSLSQQSPLSPYFYRSRDRVAEQWAIDVNACRGGIVACLPFEDGSDLSSLRSSWHSGWNSSANDEEHSCVSDSTDVSVTRSPGRSVTPRAGASADMSGRETLLASPGSLTRSASAMSPLVTTPLVSSRERFASVDSAASMNLAAFLRSPPMSKRPSRTVSIVSREAPELFNPNPRASVHQDQGHPSSVKDKKRERAMSDPDINYMLTATQRQWLMNRQNDWSHGVRRALDLEDNQEHETEVAACGAAGVDEGVFSGIKSSGTGLTPAGDFYEIAEYSDASSDLKINMDERERPRHKTSSWGVVVSADAVHVRLRNNYLGFILFEVDISKVSGAVQLVSESQVLGAQISDTSLPVREEGEGEITEDSLSLQIDGDTGEEGKSALQCGDMLSPIAEEGGSDSLRTGNGNDAGARYRRCQPASLVSVNEEKIDDDRADEDPMTRMLDVPNVQYVRVKRCDTKMLEATIDYTFSVGCFASHMSSRPCPVVEPVALNIVLSMTQNSVVAVNAIAGTPAKVNAFGGGGSNGGDYGGESHGGIISDDIRDYAHRLALHIDPYYLYGLFYFPPPPPEKPVCKVLELSGEPEIELHVRTVENSPLNVNLTNTSFAAVRMFSNHVLDDQVTVAAPHIAYKVKNLTGLSMYLCAGRRTRMYESNVGGYSTSSAPREHRGDTEKAPWGPFIPMGQRSRIRDNHGVQSYSVLSKGTTLPPKKVAVPGYERSLLDARRFAVRDSTVSAVHVPLEGEATFCTGDFRVHSCDHEQSCSVVLTFECPYQLGDGKSTQHPVSDDGKTCVRARSNSRVVDQSKFVSIEVRVDSVGVFPRCAVFPGIDGCDLVMDLVVIVTCCSDGHYEVTARSPLIFRNFTSLSVALQLTLPNLDGPNRGVDVSAASQQLVSSKNEGYLDRLDVNVKSGGLYIVPVHCIRSAELCVRPSSDNYSTTGFSQKIPVRSFVTFFEYPEVDSCFPYCSKDLPKPTPHSRFAYMCNGRAAPPPVVALRLANHDGEDGAVQQKKFDDIRHVGCLNVCVRTTLHSRGKNAAPFVYNMWSGYNRAKTLATELMLSPVVSSCCDRGDVASGELEAGPSAPGMPSPLRCKVGRKVDVGGREGMMWPYLQEFGVSPTMVLCNLLCRPVSYRLTLKHAYGKMGALPVTNSTATHGDGSGTLPVGGRVEIFEGIGEELESAQHDSLWLAARIDEVSNVGSKSSDLSAHGTFAYSSGILLDSSTYFRRKNAKREVGGSRLRVEAVDLSLERRRNGSKGSKKGGRRVLRIAVERRSGPRNALLTSPFWLVNMTNEDLTYKLGRAGVRNAERDSSKSSPAASPGSNDRLPDSSDAIIEASGIRISSSDLKSARSSFAGGEDDDACKYSTTPDMEVVPTMVPYRRTHAADMAVKLNADGARLSRTFSLATKASNAELALLCKVKGSPSLRVARYMFGVSTTNTPFPASVCSTKVLTFTPRFVLVNQLDDILMVRQSDCDEGHIFLEPNTPTPFHWADTERKRNVCLCPSPSAMDQGDCLVRLREDGNLAFDRGLDAVVDWDWSGAVDLSPGMQSVVVRGFAQRRGCGAAASSPSVSHEPYRRHKLKRILRIAVHPWQSSFVILIRHQTFFVERVKDILAHSALSAAVAERWKVGFERDMDYQGNAAGPSGDTGESASSVSCETTGVSRPERELNETSSLEVHGSNTGSSEPLTDQYDFPIYTIENHTPYCFVLEQKREKQSSGDNSSRIGGVTGHMSADVDTAIHTKRNAGFKLPGRHRRRSSAVPSSSPSVQEGKRGANRHADFLPSFCRVPFAWDNALGDRLIMLRIVEKDDKSSGVDNSVASSRKRASSDASGLLMHCLNEFGYMIDAVAEYKPVAVTLPRALRRVWNMASVTKQRPVGAMDAKDVETVWFAVDIVARGPTRVMRIRIHDVANESRSAFQRWKLKRLRRTQPKKLSHPAAEALGRNLNGLGVELGIPSVALFINVACVGISIIDEIAARTDDGYVPATGNNECVTDVTTSQELLFIFFGGIRIQACIAESGLNRQLFLLSVKHIQVDNQLPHAFYKVFLAPQSNFVVGTNAMKSSAGLNFGDDDTDMDAQSAAFRCVGIRSTADHRLLCFESIATAVAPLSLQVDEEILIRMSALHARMRPMETMLQCVHVLKVYFRLKSKIKGVRKAFRKAGFRHAIFEKEKKKRHTKKEEHSEISGISAAQNAQQGEKRGAAVIVDDRYGMKLDFMTESESDSDSDVDGNDEAEYGLLRGRGFNDGVGASVRTQHLLRARSSKTLVEIVQLRSAKNRRRFQGMFTARALGVHDPVLIDVQRFAQYEAQQDLANKLYISSLHMPVVDFRIYVRECVRDLSADPRSRRLLADFRTSIGVALPSIENVPLNLKTIDIFHFFDVPESLVTKLSAHYTSQFVREFYKVIGSLDVLGNPVHLFGRIGEGFRDFVGDPAAGFKSGNASAVAKGLATGTASLIGNTVGGVAMTAGKVTSAISDGISLLSFDNRYLRRRKRVAPVTGVKDGLLKGAAAAGRGIFEGITGVFVQPVRGAAAGGVKGFFKGVGRGLAGAAVKPVSGILDFAGKATAGFKSRKRGAVSARVRPPRLFSDDPDSAVTAYSRALAEAHAILRSIPLKRSRFRKNSVTARAAASEVFLGYWDPLSKGIGGDGCSASTSSRSLSSSAAAGSGGARTRKSTAAARQTVAEWERLVRQSLLRTESAAEAKNRASREKRGYLTFRPVLILTNLRFMLVDVASRERTRATQITEAYMCIRTVVLRRIVRVQAEMGRDGVYELVMEYLTEKERRRRASSIVVPAGKKTRKPASRPMRFVCGGLHTVQDILVTLNRQLLSS